MAKRKPILPDYGTVQIKGNMYFRTRVSDDEGNRFSLYAATREELYEKVLEVEKQIENTKDVYYNVLQDIDIGWHEEQNDPTPFIRYTLELLLAC